MDYSNIYGKWIYSVQNGLITGYLQTHVNCACYLCFCAVFLASIVSILFYPITLEGRRGTTDEFATIPFHLDLFSAALVELAKSIPVHSLILSWSSHLFFCLPLFLFPFTVPCRIVFAKPEDLETWPNHLSFRFLTRVRSSSYSPMAAWILASKWYIYLKLIYLTYETEFVLFLAVLENSVLPMGWHSSYEKLKWRKLFTNDIYAP